MASLRRKFRKSQVCIVRNLLGTLAGGNPVKIIGLAKKTFRGQPNFYITLPAHRVYREDQLRPLWSKEKGLIYLTPRRKNDTKTA